MLCNSCAGLSFRKNLLMALASRIARVDPSQVKLRPKQPENRKQRPKPRQKPWFRARKPRLRGTQHHGPQSGLRTELSLLETSFSGVCAKIPWNSQERELGSSKATRCRCWLGNLIHFCGVFRGAELCEYIHLSKFQPRTLTGGVRRGKK